MKHIKRIGILFILLVPCFFRMYAQTSTTDTTVFGFTIGSELPIPECACKVMEWNEGAAKGFLSNKRYKGYLYTTADGLQVSNTCFERTDIVNYKVKRSEQLNPLPPFLNGIVRIKFAKKDAPEAQICPLGILDATIENAKITAITFKIMAEDADAVFETLKKKYGTNAVVKNYTAQNGIGGSRNFYIAVWLFSNLTIVISSDATQTYDGRWGFVTITRPIKNNQPKDKRPL